MDGFRNPMQYNNIHNINNNNMVFKSHLNRTRYCGALQ